MRYLVILLFITCFNELIVIQLIIFKGNKINRNIPYNIFSLLDMTIWFLIFYSINKNRKGKLFTVILAVLSFIFSGIELFGYKSWLLLHTDSFRFYSLAIICLSVNYLYKVIKDNKYYNTFADHAFFLCAASLIYQSMLFIIFSTLSENSFWQFREAEYVYNLLQVITNILYYTLICASFITASINRNYYKSTFQT